VNTEAHRRKTIFLLEELAVMEETILIDTVPDSEN
jgi:hypothetical protein